MGVGVAGPTARAFVVLLGSILVWSAVWGLLEPLLSGAVWRLAVLCGGVLCSLLSGTFFSSAGVPVRSDLDQLLRDRAGVARGVAITAGGYCSTSADTVVAYLRSALALLGIIAIWASVYATAAALLPNTVLGAVLALAAGALLVTFGAGGIPAFDARGPLLDDAHAAREEERRGLVAGRRGRSVADVSQRLQEASVDVDELPAPERAMWYLRALSVYGGGAIAWLGGSILLIENVPLAPVLRDSIYIVVGAALMLATRTLVSQAMLDIDAAEARDADEEAGELVPELDAGSAAGRTVIATVALFLFWLGTDDLLSLTGSSLLVSLLLLAFGVLVLGGSGSLYAQAGVLTPVSGATNAELHAFRREVASTVSRRVKG